MSAARKDRHMAWFKRDKKSIDQATPPEERRVRTEGLWTKCENCRTITFRKDLEANLFVCPKCQFHFKMGSKQRLEMLFDGRWTEHDAGMTSTDPLKFVDTKPYASRIKEARKKLGMNDAVITAEGQLNGRPVVICAMEFGFIGGSMGAVVGEKVTRGVELALDTRQPLIVVSCSGGARMMEGTISLMQLAKVSAALARLDEAKLPYISDLDRPHHRRCHRKLCHARRSEYRRAWRADRIRWASRHRTNHSSETSRGLPALRISPGTRLSRRHRRPQGLKSFLASSLDLLMN